MEQDLTYLWVQCAIAYCESQAETILSLVCLNNAIKVTPAYTELLDSTTLPMWQQAEADVSVLVDNALGRVWNANDALEGKLRHQDKSNELVRARNGYALKQFALSLMQYMDDQELLSGSESKGMFRPEWALEVAVQLGRKNAIEAVVIEITHDMRAVSMSLKTDGADDNQQTSLKASLAIATTKAEVFTAHKLEVDMDRIIEAFEKWASIPKFKSTEPFRADRVPNYIDQSAAWAFRQ